MIRTRCGQCSSFGCLPLLLALTSFAFPAGATEWQVKPRMTVRGTYTDNVRLVSDDEENEFVTDFNPGVFITGEGPRLDFKVLYNLQAIVFPGENFDNEINHQLQSSGTTQLVDELFFFDVGGTIRQTNADNAGRLATDNISRTGNRIDTYTYRLSPYVRRRLGSYARTEVRYRFDEVINEGDFVDSKAHTVRAVIDSGTRFQRLPWRLFYSGEFVDNDDGTTTDLQNTGGNVRYRFNRQFSLLANGGYELNDFSTRRRDDSGPFWRVGAIWTPSRRTTLQAGYGDRFFGDVFFFSLSHRSRRTVWSAGFEEDIALTRQVQIEEVLVPLEDPFGERIEDPVSGADIRLPIDQATPTTEPFIRRRLDASVAVRGRRTHLVVRGFREKRDFEQTGDDELVFGADASLRRRLSRHTTFRIFGTWQESDLRGDFERTRWEGSARVQRQVGASISAAIEYRYTEQDGDRSADEFTENRISAVATLTF